MQGSFATFLSGSPCADSIAHDTSVRELHVDVGLHDLQCVDVSGCSAGRWYWSLGFRLEAAHSVD